MILNEKIKEVKIYFYTGTVKQILSYREDKLTKRISIINHTRAIRPHNINQHDKYKIAKTIKKSEKKCVFCKYEENTIPLADKERRYKRGETIIFQNLYPFEEHHYVGIITKKHYVNQFDYKNFEDMILEYKHLAEENHRHEYSYINMNFLPPSGASIIHPHVQIISRKTPTFYHKTLIEGFKKYGKEEWIIEHINKKLHIHEDKSYDVFAIFSPILNKEIAIISKENIRLSDANKTEIRKLAKYLTNIINHHIQDQFSSFNFTIYEHEIHGILTFIGSRSKFSPYYTTDKAFMELYHQHNIVSTYPENIAKEIKKLKKFTSS